MAFRDFEVVIGLEIHAQLFTESKIFSPASTKFSAGDNENVSVVCAGLPGTLPVLNKKAVELAIKTGLALNCEIKNRSVFSRKQYFYPDLAKGYQISQFDLPICGKGYVEFISEGKLNKVELTRAHMEEDAGKSTHFGEYTLINYNRAGVPLLEIVTEPVITSSIQAANYARAVRQILRYIEVCDGNLEEGSMRCDCNVSVRKKGDTKLGTRVELKNINSFKFIEKSVDYEADRQIDLIESGDKVVQETRLYDSTKNKTFSMRSKEEANDYRYFPEPDLPDLIVGNEWIKKIRSELPELPTEKRARFQKDYGISSDDTEKLILEKDIADYFEIATKASGEPKLTANWLVGEFTAKLNETKTKLEKVPVNAENFGELVKLVSSGKISGKMAKQVFAKMWETKKAPADLVKDMGLEQISDESTLTQIIEGVLQKNPDNVTAYRSGKVKLFGFFVGQVMKLTQGQANPEVVNKILKEKLK